METAYRVRLPAINHLIAILLKHERAHADKHHSNVQVTLQILEALIEKAPRDLPLYSKNVLRIFKSILESLDITMVDASIPTFEAFCLHHDGASLSADSEYLKQYEEIVRIYADFASTRTRTPPLAESKPVQMRWRVIGLKAIKSVSSSEALSSVAGRQLDVIMPILLENLWTDDHSYLETIINRARLEDRVDTERLLHRRGSIATVRTFDSENPNPLTLTGSAAEADKLAEEDIGVIALQCLKSNFSVNNRSQIRGGTLAVLQFVSDRVENGELVQPPSTAPNAAADKGWATTIFLAIAQWTPIQERYTVLTTAVEALVKSLNEDSTPQDSILLRIIRALLRSDINMMIPERVKTALLSEWSKDSVLKSLTETSRSGSPNGSKAGSTKTSPEKYLTVNGKADGQQPHTHRHHSRPPSQVYGLVGNNSKLRQPPGPDKSPSDSSKLSITRVEHLKRVLSGAAPPSRGITAGGPAHSSSGSESMLSYDGGTEFSYETRGPGGSRARSKSRERGEQGKNAHSPAVKDRAAVPPVPKLPASLSIGFTPSPSKNFTGDAGVDEANEMNGGAVQGAESKPADGPEVTLTDYLKRNRDQSRGREGKSVGKGSAWGEDSGAIDLDSLLKGIDLEDKKGVAGMVEPPY